MSWSPRWSVEPPPRWSAPSRHRVDLVTEMTYRRLGDSGLVVSVVGIGCNNFGRKLDVDGTRAVVDAALDAGITLFDTADIYGEPQGGSEELLGAGAQGPPGRRGGGHQVRHGHGRRSTAPDFGARGSRRYIARAVEASLRRLGTDHIDLYQMHEPDPGTPIDETLAALDDLVRAGKVRYLGNSNFAGWQIADADWIARTARPTRVHQRAEPLQPAGARRSRPRWSRPASGSASGMLPFFPLANGLLTGKYRRGEAAAGRQPAVRRRPVRAAGSPRADWDTIEALEAYARRARADACSRWRSAGWPPSRRWPR